MASLAVIPEQIFEDAAVWAEVGVMMGAIFWEVFGTIIGVPFGVEFWKSYGAIILTVYFVMMLICGKLGSGASIGAKVMGEKAAVIINVGVIALLSLVIGAIFGFAVGTLVGASVASTVGALVGAAAGTAIGATVAYLFGIIVEILLIGIFITKDLTRAIIIGIGTFACIGIMMEYI